MSDFAYSWPISGLSNINQDAIKNSCTVFKAYVSIYSGIYWKRNWGVKGSFFAF